jgi:hypothetical protein
MRLSTLEKYPSKPPSEPTTASKFVSPLTPSVERLKRTFGRVSRKWWVWPSIGPACLIRNISHCRTLYLSLEERGKNLSEKTGR